MNITFLIGNGFDRNLGLKTAYSDFVSYYKGLDTTDETLIKFHEHINENEELWSSAEEEIGKYTKEFEEGEGDRKSFLQMPQRFLRKSCRIFERRKP